MRKKQFFFVFFPELFRILSKNFSDFRPKNFKKVFKTTYLSRGKVCDLVLFKFSNVSDFLQKPSAWFSIFYLRVKKKKLRKKQFLSFFSRIFFDFWAKIFQTFGQKTSKKFSKLPTCPEEKFVAWKFFLKFWIVLDFLQKPSAWFSKFYLPVQSKNCGKNSFFLFSFQNFFEFWAKTFQTFGQKTSKKFSKLPTCPEEKFVTWKFFLKFWIVLDFLQKLLAWFSNFYLRVQSKNCGKNSFFVLFSEFFRIMSENFSEFWPKNFKKIVKTTYVSRGKVCDVIFFKFSNVLDFLQKHLAWFSKFYLRVQSKNCGKNRFFLFSFQNFFEFWAKTFQTFGQKTSKKFSKLPTCPEEKFVAWKFFLKFWIVLDFLQKPSAWFSKFYLRVQSKNCGKNSFFCFLSRTFSNFEQKLFRLSAKKLQKSFQNYLRVQRKSLWLESFF